MKLKLRYQMLKSLIRKFLNNIIALYVMHVLKIKGEQFIIWKELILNIAIKNINIDHINLNIFQSKVQSIGSFPLLTKYSLHFEKWSIYYIISYLRWRIHYLQIMDLDEQFLKCDVFIYQHSLLFFMLVNPIIKILIHYILYW